MARLLSLCAGLTFVVATVVVTLAQLDAVEAPQWMGAPHTVVGSVAVLAALGAGPHFRAAWTGYRGGPSQLRRRDVEDVLAATFPNLIAATTADWATVGMHAFTVHRPLFRRARLVRVGRLRLGNRPGTAQRITWTEGKGVIGRCWLEKEDVAVNIARINKEIKGLTAEEWMDRGADERLGMTLDEVKAAKDFGAIVASPIMDGHRFLGCVAVDGPEGTYQQLTSEAARSCLRDACVALKGLIRPIRLS